MKRFLLVLGILLWLQSCVLARDLRDLGNGFYVDIDSYRRDGNYCYVEVEIHRPVLTITSIWKLDLINHKMRIIKTAERDINGKVVWVLEEFEMPKELQGWQDIPENSRMGNLFKVLKNMNETIPN